MTARRAALKTVVDLVADGTSDLDWDAIDAQFDDERDHALIRQLQILARISDVQRREMRSIDEDALYRSARVLASRIPAQPVLRRAEVQRDVVPLRPKTADDDQLTQTEQWGRFELLECIGRGAFGDVYRAFDAHLCREVALKMLRHDQQQERIVDEARVLARVRHPNVVTVHAAEPWDGRVGICMEFVRGKTLEQILSTEGVRSAREAALIGQDLCQALSAVHAVGLVHRDVKPQNVMREDGGRIVLMDFGAGQALRDENARPLRLTGTPLYTAPEVLAGAEASVRSDIYSLGVLLYHLVTNDYPVRGYTYDELRDAHAHGRRHRLRDAAPGAPAWFVRVVERAIAPDPKDRYVSVGELEAALAAQRGFDLRVVLMAAAMVLALVAAVVTWPILRGSSTRPPLVVLLPLDAGLGVESHIAHAITDEIYQSLAMIDTLRVSSPQSAVNAKSAGLTMPEVTNRLRAAAVVGGTVSQIGDELEVKLRLFQARSDSPSWAQTFQVSRVNLASLRHASALSIASAVNVEVRPRIVTQLRRPATASTQAYDAYARGLYSLARASRSDLEDARAEFERAVQLDSSFAPAYGALGHVYLDLGSGARRSEWSVNGPLARLAARKALELDPSLAEAHAVLAEVAFQLDWDWGTAENAFRRATSLSTSYDFARIRYAHFLAARARVAEALEQLEEARRLDPYSNTADLELVSMLQYADRFSEAETMARALEGRAANPNAVHTRLGRIFAATGRFNEAIAEFQKLRDSSAGEAYAEAEIASAHAAAGRTAEALAGLDRLIERSTSEEVSPELFSLVYTRLGRFDDAFRHLHEAMNIKARRILWMKVDPRWDPLRSDARFDVLLKRLGL